MADLYRNRLARTRRCTHGISSQSSFGPLSRHDLWLANLISIFYTYVKTLTSFSIKPVCFIWRNMPLQRSQNGYFASSITSSQHGRTSVWWKGHALRLTSVLTCLYATSDNEEGSHDGDIPAVSTQLPANCIILPADIKPWHLAITGYSKNIV